MSYVWDETEEEGPCFAMRLHNVSRKERVFLTYAQQIHHEVCMKACKMCLHVLVLDRDLLWLLQLEKKSNKQWWAEEYF